MDLWSTVMVWNNISTEDRWCFYVQLTDTLHGISARSIPCNNRNRPQRQGGRLLSGLLAANIVFLGGALICGGVLSEVPVQEDEVMVMLTAMMVLAVVWMVVYISCTARHRTAPLYKDPHAAPVWLRGGLPVLGACSVLLDIFKLVRAAGLPGCEHPIKFLFPSAEILFLFIQSYFLWVHSKDCAQVHQHFTRCGLAISLVTNLMLWMSAAAEESIHHTGVQGEKVPENQSQTLTGKYGHLYETNLDSLMDSKRGAAGDGCVCCTRVCRVLQAASPYLYPFNIEYSLLCSALCFVMWRNVGRAAGCGRAAAEELEPARGSAGPGPGLVLGAALLLGGLVVSIVYQVEVKEARTRSRALLTHYTFHSAALALMSAACVLGWAAVRGPAGTGSHWRGPAPTGPHWRGPAGTGSHWRGPAPTGGAQRALAPTGGDRPPLAPTGGAQRALAPTAGSLDQGLLLGATTGPLLTCSFSLVAVVWSRRPGSLHHLSLVYSLLSVAQHSLQNLFILGALRWPAALDTAPGASLSRTSSPTPRDPAGGVNVPGTVAASSPESRQRPHPPPGARRRLLKEVSSFLLLCNILFWAVSAFGARPHFANGIEEKFYGFQMWAAIVNTGLPLGIFYRMHSAANLLEIYLTS
ncbi:proton channel OTOP2-like [Rhinoraja longicauda]